MLCSVYSYLTGKLFKIHLQIKKNLFTEEKTVKLNIILKNPYKKLKKMPKLEM